MLLRDHGNHEAWSEFVAIYEPVIYRLAGRRHVQDAEAREIVQEVLIRIARAIDRFDPKSGGSFRGWLSQTTRRVAVDRFRYMESREQATGGDKLDAFANLSEDARESTSKSQVENEFDDEHRKQLFRHAAGQVKAMVAETTWIAFWETAVNNRSGEEVARQLGIQPGTVYVAKCRVLKRIRQFIQNQQGES